MSIQPKRLAILLSESRFQLAWSNRAGECGFVRSSHHDDLYEQVIVKTAGGRGEAVFANAAVSVVSGPMATKGMVEMALLDELATDVERGWAIIERADQAVDWERRLASIGSARVSDVARTKGSALLERTERARSIASSVMASIPLAVLTELSAVQNWVTSRASESARVGAERLAEWPGVMRLAGGEQLYRTAVLALAVLGPNGRQVERDPIAEPEAMWEIQLLADRLMRRLVLDADALRASAAGA